MCMYYIPLSKGLSRDEIFSISIIYECFKPIKYVEILCLLYGYAAWSIGYIMIGIGLSIYFSSSLYSRVLRIIGLNIVPIFFSTICNFFHFNGKIHSPHGGIIGSYICSYIIKICTYFAPIALGLLGLLTIFLIAQKQGLFILYSFSVWIFNILYITHFIRYLKKTLYAWISYFIPFTKNNTIENLIEESVNQDIKEIQSLFGIINNNTIEQSTNNIYEEILPCHTLHASKDISKKNIIQKVDEKEYSLLLQKAKELDLEFSYIDGYVGPVVTTIIINPSQKTKLNTIIAQEYELARLMGKPGFRIVYPLKQYPFYIACEYENSERNMIHFNDYINNITFAKKHTFSVDIVIGLDTKGNPIIKDLSILPHIFICGTTGSGKSSLMHSYITNILWNYSSSDVNIVLIDPKQVEYYLYEHTPHLYMPIARFIDQICHTIESLIILMNKRYEILSEYKVRNIKEFRELHNDKKNMMPYIVVFIDEYADIIYQKKEIEFSIIRLAQMARACGIHLILATQRPSADIVNGNIKANIPVRIACRVSSELDSRIIIGSKGAENLLGKGDMLLLNELGELERLHGLYLSLTDIERIVSLSIECKKNKQKNFRID